jgi:hypothetical protein
MATATMSSSYKPKVEETTQPDKTGEVPFTEMCPHYNLIAISTVPEPWESIQRPETEPIKRPLRARSHIEYGTLYKVNASGLNAGHLSS